METVIVRPPAADSSESCVAVNPPDAVFATYLTRAPLAHVLFRAAEAGALADVSLPGPVLDLGCGAGEFASLALRGSVDDGLDVSPTQLNRAARTGRYLRLHQGDARCLPFADDQFASVLSVSVLEHISDPELVLAEAFRVLRPGGRFVGTVLLADVHRHLFFPRLFNRLRLGFLARAYHRCHDQAFHHRTLLSREEWECLLGRAGFDVRRSHLVVNPTMTGWWDFFLPAAIPYRMLSGWGRAAVWHPDWFRAWAWRRFGRLLKEDDREGSVLVFEAVKPGAAFDSEDWLGREEP